MLRLTTATAHAPMSVTLYCEQILCELAHTSHTTDILTGGTATSVGSGVSVSQKIITLLLPYFPSATITTTATTTTTNSNGTAPSHNDTTMNSTTQLFAFHVMTHVVRFLSTGQLLGAVDTMSSGSGASLLHQVLYKVIPLLSSSIIDIRQSAVFLLVELYACIGDVLWSYLTSLTPTQKTLLTIYIDRQLKQKQQLQYRN